MMPRITLQTLPGYARNVLAAVENNAARFPVAASVGLPGLELAAYLDHGLLADAVGDAFVSFQDGKTAPGRRALSRIFVAHPGIGDIPSPARWGEALFDPHAFSMRLDEAGLRGSYFHDLNYWQFYDPKCRVGAQLMSLVDGFPPWEPGAPLRSFLHWEYAARGMRLTHAGTLGADGRGVLLAGPGGAGKSGTVVAGILNGLDSVGDDYVLIDVSSGVSAFPLFRTVKQDPAGFDRLKLRDRLGPPGAPNWQGKYQFRIEDISARPVPARLDIAALLVPDVSGSDRTEIKPLSRRDAMIALAPSGIAQMPGERASGFRFFSEMARMLPCYHLSLGTRPEEIAGAISEFLARSTA